MLEILRESLTLARDGDDAFAAAVERGRRLALPEAVERACAF